MDGTSTKDDARNTNKMYRANLHQKQPKGRPKARLKDEVENYTKNKDGNC
jgi:hypothetical protein